MRGLLSSASASGPQFSTLPALFRPGQDTIIGITEAANTPATGLRLIVYANGELHVSGYSGTTKPCITATFPLDIQESNRVQLSPADLAG